MNKLTETLFFIAALMFYPSCKKSDIQKSPDPTTLDSATIMGFKDSTQLIKSIHFNFFDSTGAITDSVTEYYFYDTIKRKITISLKGYSNSPQVYIDSSELNYNSSGLLVHLDNISSQPSQDSFSIASINYTYDASNIIKTASVKYFNGQVNMFSFTKTLLPSGNYQISWVDTSPGNISDSMYYLVNFDSKGKLLSYYNYSVNSSDSIIYDAIGNINKVVETDYTSSGFTTFTLYDFLSRDTKGDQLYNLNQILNNGIANMPSDIAQFASGEIGGQLSSEYAYQYTKFSALSTNINNPIPVNFNSTPQYDNQNRLIKYRMFSNDANINYTDYIISYYK